MELNQLRYPFAEQASQINGFVLKEKKKHILLDSVETNLNIWRVQWVRDKSESKYQRVQDKSETIEKRLESGLESETGLEYYSPRSTGMHNCWLCFDSVWNDFQYFDSDFALAPFWNYHNYEYLSCKRHLYLQHF